MTNRPWDFEQEFEVTSDGETSPVDGTFGQVVNNRERLTADAVEREEVRELTADARQRHHDHDPRWRPTECHECANWRPCIELHDVPWGERPV